MVHLEGPGLVGVSLQALKEEPDTRCDLCSGGGDAALRSSPDSCVDAQQDTVPQRASLTKGLLWTEPATEQSRGCGVRVEKAAGSSELLSVRSFAGSAQSMSR